MTAITHTKNAHPWKLGQKFHNCMHMETLKLLKYLGIKDFLRFQY